MGREGLERLLAVGLAAVDAGDAVGRHVHRDPDRTLQVAGEGLPAEVPITLLAAGKAAVPMARAFVGAAGAQVVRGLVVSKDGHGGDAGGLPVRECGHPVPDARSEAAGREALALAAAAEAAGALVVLLSGGASALLACPASGLRLADLAVTTDLLLASGAAIDELNAVRKHLSALAGGQLARAFTGDAIRVLAVSDVPGDRLDVIGSGPCTGDPTSFADAARILGSRGLEPRLPAAVREHVEAGLRGERPETPGPEDESLIGVRARIVARNADALLAVAEAARAQGLRVEVDPVALSGEARDAARGVVARARAAAGGDSLLWLAGGETTVSFDRAGRGGRNQELALAAALEVAGDERVALLAAGTDGSDGPTDAAGAFVDGGSVVRGASRNADARDALERHDSYTFWQAEGGLLRTGPTGTNVMDVVFISLGGSS
ncbi:MAG: DUF4147 domain-containing protein [Deltaproteobacteria bacterium]|nr:DUF4147 domain-containing protein [Deltaproteobacteria bacterium]MBW2446033.1 DUF4147 domain-containing protein [Deltaproteobacteria bacterium]